MPAITPHSASIPPNGTPAPAPAPARPRGGIEKRRATRVPRKSHAQLIFWPAGPRSNPIDVQVVDYSLTGIGIISAETLPPGQKFVVREPFVTSGNTCIYTVVRSDQRPDGSYSVGLHVGDTAEFGITQVEVPPKPGLTRGWQFTFFLFAVTGTILVISMTLLKNLF